ncbi:hypothetical protein OBBRIDRAFT_791676 [Obba rivulosa]|uniref:Uncharacterized protein n=1 Tax=Obba rivulosa TaxID=1052685 RepID=A0A8E2AVZ1_9APHY|nr:hypothetical protein OBBRIDRAFT_791676 [Obba rivulosa]
MAEKFQADELRFAVLDRFKQAWPLSWKEWERWEARIDAVDRQYRASRHMGNKRILSVSDCVPEPVNAIRFARENQCPEVLPAVLVGSIRQGRYNARPQRPGKRDCRDRKTSSSSLVHPGPGSAVPPRRRR